jgi:hypothetical protein
MSEFRLFCIGAFIGMALFAVADNHGLVVTAANHRNPLVMAVSGFLLGCVAVGLLGKKKL